MVKNYTFTLIILCKTRLKKNYFNIGLILSLLFIFLLGSVRLRAQGQNIENATITITFAGAPTQAPVVKKTLLKYNKDFALILQMDDGSDDIYDKVYPYFRGQQGNPGLFFSDGVTNYQWFKMGSVHYSEDANGNDVHLPGTNFVSWDEMNTLWAAYFGIESRGFENPTNPLYPYYEVNRNISFTKRYTSFFIPGGLNMDVYVIPPGGDGQIQEAKLAGNLAIYDERPEALSNPLRLDSISSFQNKEYSRNRISNNLFNEVQQMANNSNASNHYLATYYCQGFDNGTDISFDNFKTQMNQISNAYGVNGSNTIWSASATEVFEYLALRDKITVHQNLNGNVLEITFTGDNIPANFRWYSLTVTVKADTNITNMTVTPNYYYSYKYDKDSAVINLNWNGSSSEAPETVAERFIQKAAANPTPQTCLIAKDYVEIISNADSLAKYKDELCSVCNGSLPGYCSYLFNVPNDTICRGDSATLTAPDGMKSYLWSNSETSQSIHVAPDTTTQYWIEVVTQDDQTSRDTVWVTVNPLPQFAHSPDTISNNPGHDTTLWVTGNYNYLWSTGATDTSIVVAPKINTHYFVEVTNEYLCSLRQHFFVKTHYEYNVDFSYDTVCFGDTTHLINLSTTNDSVLQVVWDLNGDGVFEDAFGDSVIHRYTHSGLLLTGMRITYASGAMKLAYHSVPVADPPNVWFGYSGICSPNTSTSFSDSTTVLVGSPVSWYWNYGDGNFDVGRFVSHRYIPGTYSPQLVVTTTYGCLDSARRNITIFANPDFTLLREDETQVFNGDTVFIPNGDSAYLKIENPAQFDSIIWPSGQNSNDYYLSTEGQQTVFVYKNICSSFSDFLGVFQGGHVFPGSDTAKIMNLFTPNGDGFNDEWIVNNKNITFPIIVNIYTRYGNLVYHSDNYQNDWKGYYNGNILPKGTYYYIVKDADNQIFTGPLTIIR